MEKRLLIFPWKLHELLKEVEQNNQSDIISWTPGGKSFVVHDKERFCNEIMPSFFASQSPQLFKTFQRSLNLWGFKYVDSSLPKAKSGNKNFIEYSHACFVQGKPDMCSFMKRVRVQGIRSRPYHRNAVAAKKKKTKTSTKKKIAKKSTNSKKKKAPNKVSKIRPVELDSFSPANSENLVGSGIPAAVAGTTTSVISTQGGEHQLIASSTSVGPAASQQSRGSSNDSPLVEMLLQRLLVPTVATPPQKEHRQDSFNNLGGLTEPPSNLITSLAHLLARGHNRDQQLGFSAVGTTTTNSLLPILDAISLVQPQILQQQQQYHREPRAFLPSSPLIAHSLGLLYNDPNHQRLRIVKNDGNLIPPQLSHEGTDRQFPSPLFWTAPAPASNGNNLTDHDGIINLVLAQVLGVKRQAA